MVVAFENPCNQNLGSYQSCHMGECSSEEKWLTIPNAKTAPRPRTIPYPQPTLRGGAIAILAGIEVTSAKL